MKSITPIILLGITKIMTGRVTEGKTVTTKGIPYKIYSFPPRYDAADEYVVNEPQSAIG